MIDDLLILYLIAGVGGCLLSLFITPVVRSVSTRFGFVDRPDGHRKMHKKAVALGGGAALLLALAGTLLLVFAYGSTTSLRLLHDGNAFELVALLGSAVFIVALGLVDDFVGLRGRHKVLGQLLVVGLLIYAGIRIEGFSVFGTEVKLYYFAIPATAFWLLGTTNGINLIDGIDGLAGSVGFILSLTMAAITGWQGHVLETTIMLALAGAQLGFLRYNFAPASIYLGDAGSMLIGLLCGTIAVHSSAKSSAAMAFAVPIAVWSIPILDTFAALLRRKLTGRSLFTADRGHLHHSLLVRGWSVRQAAMFIALICTITCLSAVLSFYEKNEMFALVTVGIVMLFLIYTRTFGHIEFALVTNQMRKMANSLVRTDAYDSTSLNQSCLQLQGSREWGKLWAAIIESAENYDLVKIKLTINMPAIHESFYATWETPQNWRSKTDRSWRVAHPLVVEDAVIGQLDLVGLATKEGTVRQIAELLDFLEPIEDDIREIRETLVVDHTTMKIGKPKAPATSLIDTPTAETADPTLPGVHLAK